jgi:hypothetical protein
MMMLRVDVKLDVAAVTGIRSKMICTHLIIGIGCVRVYERNTQKEKGW